MAHKNTSLIVSALVLLSGARICSAQQPQDLPIGRPVGDLTAHALSLATHPAVGSWFGEAQQLCAEPINANTCLKFTILMTPSLFSDGIFTGVDNTAIGGPPFGPHTPAFGTWYPLNDSIVVADYIFMSNPYPAPPATAPAMSVSRFRWESQVTDANTMVGYINFYAYPSVPLTWVNPTDPTKFPTLPAETAGPLTAPFGVITDPATCQTAGCPLVFKFTVKRVNSKSVFGF